MLYLWTLGEVMDKEPAIAGIWLFSVGAAAVMFVLAQVGKKLVVVVGPLSLLLAYGTVSETWDPYVGSAIVREAGYAYVVQCHLAAVLIIIASLVGVVNVFRRKGAATSFVKSCRTGRST